jgi:hypothetical protein
MQPYYDVFIRGTEYEERFKVLAENERLVNHLVALRRTLWDMRAKICQLERLLEESTDIKAEATALQAQIDSTAERLRLQPMMVEGD